MSEKMTLAEMRQSKRVGRPQSTYHLCLAAGIAAEIEALDTELYEAAEETTRGKPRRAADGGRAREIAERQDELRGEMAQHTGELTLRATESGKWRTWASANPPREDNKRDRRITYDLCNADALIEALADYAFMWNGEELSKGDWEWIKENAAPGDLDGIAQRVVTMHESQVNLPKSRRAWLNAQQSSEDSGSLEPGESPDDAS